MKQVLTIVKAGNSNKYIGEDSLKRRYVFNSETTLRKGQSVLLRNGVLTGIVQTEEVKTFKV